MGALGYLIDSCIAGTRRRRRKPLRTVEIKVKMDCDECVRKVKNALTSMRGVRSVEITRKENRVRVAGHIEPDKVLKKARRTGKKRAELWPYVRYNLVSYPYVVGAYENRTPAGYVRNVAQVFPVYGENVVQEEALATMFSDDNANACTTM